MDPVPALGQHTTAILHELGYDDATIRRLQAERAV
jgi:crotonobetainyl-CoA:carnitine CoA-transferase CaiB-like acyl-CoA transferase